MRILVTGAAGFLGRAVVESLLAHGEREIRCFVRPNCDLTGLKKICSPYPEAHLEYVKGNLASPEDVCRAVQGVDTIYHLAAGMKGAPATIFVNTVVASKCLIDAIQDRRRRVVLVSSVGVYDTSPLKTDRAIDETTELDPYPEKRNVYFHAKIWQEHLFREQAKLRNIDLVVVRPGVLYGRGNPNYGFPSRVGLTIGKLLLVLGNGNPLPLSHVVNCAEAVVLAGRNAEASGQSYNVVDDDLPRGSQYLREYKKSVGNNVRTIPFRFFFTILLSHLVQKLQVKTHGQIPAVLTPYEAKAIWKGHHIDNRKIKKLGWKQIISTDQAMHETFAYLRTSLNGRH